MDQRWRHCARGSVPAARNPKVKVAVFASYADCLKSFVKVSEPIATLKADPVSFAATLQGSGKFGINPDGSKVYNYVSQVAATIRGLRPYIAHRRAGE